MTKAFRITVACVVMTVFLGTTPAAAEQIEMGFLGGFQLSRANLPESYMSMSYDTLAELSFGFHLSTFFLKGRFGLHPEINYLSRGIKTRESALGQEVTSRYTISYLEIPVLLIYRISLGGRIEARPLLGPYIGIPLKSKEIQTAGGQTNKRDLGDNLKNPDIGLVLGMQMGFLMDRTLLFLDVRFNLGFLNISKNIQDVSYDFNEEDVFRNRSLSMSIGFAFNLSPNRH